MNQLPFSSINYGTCTLPEGQMIIKSIIEGCIAGTGPLGQTSIFPCGIFKCDREINLYKGTPNYYLFKLALKSTAKRFYPNYANNNWSVNNAAIAYDRDLKTRVLADLFDNNRNYYDKLINIFTEKPELAEELHLEVEDGLIYPIDRVYPEEETSTINKPVAQFSDELWKTCLNVESLIA